ncbi:MAG: nucleotidyltransferase family protein [Dehalococcoidales bacterium]|nr:nucleotidyltransferase family protein [Dehalococcoidales bacterium]
MTVNDLRKTIIPILKKYDVSKAAVFGSVARDENTSRSDIDLLVEFKGEKSLLDLSGLKIELEEILGIKVDVLTYDSLNPLIRDRILEEQKVLI